MKQTTIVAAALALAVAAAPITTHASRVGAPAPAFNGTDSKGKVHNLSDFKGKWVVLEWHNEGCPYVRKHYGGNNMQKLQKEWTAKGVVWLTVLSSAAGQQGHMEAAQADAYFAQKNAAPSAVLLDCVRRDRAPLRRQDHAAHVRHQPRRHPGLQRRDRRQADQRSGRPRDRYQLRVGGAQRRHGRQGRHDGDVASLRLRHQVRAVTALQRPSASAERQRP